MIFVIRALSCSHPLVIALSSYHFILHYPFGYEHIIQLKKLLKTLLPIDLSNYLNLCRHYIHAWVRVVKILIYLTANHHLTLESLTHSLILIVTLVNFYFNTLSTIEYMAFSHIMSVLSLDWEQVSDLLSIPYAFISWFKAFVTLIVVAAPFIIRPIPNIFYILIGTLNVFEELVEIQWKILIVIGGILVKIIVLQMKMRGI